MFLLVPFASCTLCAVFQWSFGVTSWEVFSLGRAPYPALEAVAIPKFLDSGQRLEKPLLCPESL